MIVSSILKFKHALRQIATGSEMERFENGGIPGLAAPTTAAEGHDPHGPQPDTGKKPKKPVSVQKQVQSKLSLLSSRIGDIMTWQSKVKDSDKMCLTCKELSHQKKSC